MTKNVRMLRSGYADPLPEKRLLHAGPVTVILEDGGLRYIRCGGREVIRGIYAAVRDRNWGTIHPVFRRLDVTEESDSFRVEFTAEHRQGEIDFEWEGTIVGSADGTIEFNFDGEARSTFLKNRIGFCVLHPSELAGQPAEVETVHAETGAAAGDSAGADAHRMAGGATVVMTAGAFPDRISPHQPFMNISAIRHEVLPGLTAELRFKGELFEMEDQRNWTDASFKTYCTPLAIPFPEEIRQGERVRQTVTLRLLGDLPLMKHSAASVPSAKCLDAIVSSTEDLIAVVPSTERLTDVPDAATMIQVELEERTVGRIPELGLAVTPGRRLDEQEAEALRKLRLSFLRATLRLTGPEWEQELAIATEAASTLAVGLELETVGGYDNGQLASLVRAIAEKGIPVEAIFAYAASAYVGSGELLTLLIKLRDEAGLHFRAGSGTRANFAELNRAELPYSQMDAVMYTINPQIHAFDLSSMAEAVSAQGDTVRSARAIIGDTPISVGPITFKPRLSPVATTEEAARRAEDRATHTDPRQWSLFGAGWTLGSLRSLAEAKADRACYFETTSPLGVIRDGGEALPYPLYHVLAAAGPLQGADVLSCQVTDRLSCEALAVRRSDGGITLLVANYTDEKQRIVVKAPMFCPTRVRTLDEQGVLTATEDGGNVESLVPQLRDLPVPLAGEECRFEFELLPFAFSILEEGESAR